MNSITQLLAERISMGLSHASITDAGHWATNYRVMGKPYPGPWSFKRHPWLYEMHEYDGEHMVGQKSAQMGYTEAAINRAFYFIDILQESVLYVLPTERPDAVDFSAARFNPALEMSEHLGNLFSDTKNLGLKRAGNACLYIRSARSTSQLKSIPAGNLFFDERDEMSKEAISLARERSSGQEHKTEFTLSTPTVPNKGVNADFALSDQRHFVFKCPHCSKHTTLTYPDCIVITAERHYDGAIKDSYYICKECKHKLDHLAKIEWLGLDNASWQPQAVSRIAGFYINQMYSFTIKPWEFAVSALKADISDSDEQEFYNSKLGMPHVVEGAKINDNDLDECTGGYERAKAVHHNNRFITMGVDVGKRLNVEIDEYVIDDSIRSTDVSLRGIPRMLHEFELAEFEELDELMLRYRVNCCVIDRQPESRKAKEFCQRWEGIAWTCTYGNAISSRDITIHEDIGDMRVTVDRTSWLDLALGRFKRKAIRIPINTSMTYKDQLKAPSRVYRKNSVGDQVGRYVETDEDHYAHSRNYSEIAFKLGMSLLTTKSITSGVI